MPHSEYARRIQRYEALLREGARRLRNLANARLFTFVAAAGGALWAYTGSTYGLALLFVAGVSFILLVRVHNRRHEEHARNEALLEINEAGVARLEDRWHAFPDNGQSFVSQEHPFSGDLDVFGQGSLFQWCSTAVTAWGRKHLAAALTSGPRALEDMQADQEAVRELAPQLDWRQTFQAEGLRVTRKAAPPEALVEWAEEDTILIGPSAAVLHTVLPVITVGAIGAAYFGFVTWTPATILMIVQLAVFFRSAKRVFAIANRLRMHGEGIEVYRNMLSALEGAQFKSQRMRSLYENVGTPSAGEAIASLSTIIAWLDVQRIGIVHFVLNAVLLWDFQCIRALQRWRLRHGRLVRRWLETIADVEVLATWAAVAHDHPDWTFAVFDDSCAVTAEAVAHPLIPAGVRVANNVHLGGEPAVLVITGSNMSGKSTYMRTLGTNLVLAFAGAPVCAQRFQTGPLSTYTSMRNADNLEKNVSSFYAELLRVKMIVEAARRREPVLFLIDEIFRGTNSADRHTGAVTVLRTLRDLGAIGMVSTHDLELGQIGETEPKFGAANFSENFEGDKIDFPYKLHPGVSKTRNAVHLMRMVGIL